MSDHVVTSPVTLEQYRAMDMADKRQVWLDISDISEAEFETPAHGETIDRRNFGISQVFQLIKYERLE